METFSCFFVDPFSYCGFIGPDRHLGQTANQPPRSPGPNKQHSPDITTQGERETQTPFVERFPTYASGQKHGPRRGKAKHVPSMSAVLRSCRSSLETLSCGSFVEPFVWRKWYTFHFLVLGASMNVIQKSQARSMFQMLSKPLPPVLSQYCSLGTKGLRCPLAGILPPSADGRTAMQQNVGLQAKNKKHNAWNMMEYGHTCRHYILHCNHSVQSMRVCLTTAC